MAGFNPTRDIIYHEDPSTAEIKPLKSYASNLAFIIGNITNKYCSDYGFSDWDNLQKDLKRRFDQIEAVFDVMCSE